MQKLFHAGKPTIALNSGGLQQLAAGVRQSVSVRILSPIKDLPLTDGAISDIGRSFGS